MYSKPPTSSAQALGLATRPVYFGRSRSEPLLKSLQVIRLRRDDDGGECRSTGEVASGRATPTRAYGLKSTEWFWYAFETGYDTPMALDPEEANMIVLRKEAFSECCRLFLSPLLPSDSFSLCLSFTVVIVFSCVFVV
jgi:hypothetical protein